MINAYLYSYFPVYAAVASANVLIINGTCSTTVPEGFTGLIIIPL